MVRHVCDRCVRGLASPEHVRPCTLHGGCQVIIQQAIQGLCIQQLGPCRWHMLAVAWWLHTPLPCTA